MQYCLNEQLKAQRAYEPKILHKNKQIKQIISQKIIES